MAQGPPAAVDVVPDHRGTILARPLRARSRFKSAFLAESRDTTVVRARGKIGAMCPGRGKNIAVGGCFLTFMERQSV